MEQPLIIPRPPEDLADVSAGLGRFIPAAGMDQFVRSAFLDENSKLFNLDHIHLAAATIGYLWTNAPNKRRMKRVVGEAEIPNPKGGAWSKARVERQLIDWFGDVPDFVVTLDADYCLEANDVPLLALLEHELYHCGQQLDDFGFPKFRQDGTPIFAMRGHDVEEFAGVVRRYGIAAAGPDAVDFVKIAKAKPEIAAVTIAALCGSCIV